MSTLALVGSCLLGETLVWSGLAKLGHPRATAAALVAFKLLRAPSRVAAIGASGCEVLIGVAVLGASGAAAGTAWLLAVVALLFAGMTAIVSLRLIESDSFVCMCFGSPDTKLSVTSLIRTAGLTGVAAASSALAFDHAGHTSLTAFISSLVACGALLGSAAILSGIRRIGGRIDPFDFGNLSGPASPQLTFEEQR